jgi:hypothetical protein
MLADAMLRAAIRDQVGDIVKRLHRRVRHKKKSGTDAERAGNSPMEVLLKAERLPT